MQCKNERYGNAHLLKANENILTFTAMDSQMKKDKNTKATEKIRIFYRFFFIDIK